MDEFEPSRETTGDLTLGMVVARDRWALYASTEGIFARGATPRGEVSLTRGPGVGRNAEETANGAECWTLSLRGEPRLVIDKLGSPGYPAQRSLSRGVEGKLDGVPFRASAKSALRPSRRYVALEGDSIDVRFITRRMTPRLVEGGHEVGAVMGRRWELNSPSDGAVLAACLYEWAVWVHFLRTPVIRQM
ncbi:hypothetical protein [Streptomyces hydrogenans]|uniref:hypothetical protein n=1 Tax=Streptomyces hydrogenans TaxID=1873719 RepID=UPI00278BE724|nr:hypothetical protein [Streptomyces hydrogenans]